LVPASVEDFSRALRYVGNTGIPPAQGQFLMTS
jgi:hypothetical protein